MINKVSDFRIAESVLRSLCEENSCVFKDVETSFDEGKIGSLFVGDAKNVSHTIYKIISLYIQESPRILGKQLIPDPNKKDDFLIGLANYLRGLVHADNVFSDSAEGLHKQKLYQRPFVWLVMKNIICPVYDKPLKNTDVVCGESPYIDVAKYYAKGDINKNGKSNDPFIFVNIIDNSDVQNAFLIIEAIKSYGLSPVEVIKDIYEGELYDKFYGLLKLALNSEKNIIQFENILLNVLNIDLLSLGKEVTGNTREMGVQKVAQNLYPETSSQWWYLGIVEKLLDPARGDDWSTHYNLERYNESFWDNVEKLRKKKAKKGGEWSQLPFNKLLELKKKHTVEHEGDPNLLVQRMLTDTRIW
tara:strand:+ start:27739 stop:28815 length:1077 start_codon:yes stop_codon:yes gene_type:complete